MYVNRHLERMSTNTQELDACMHNRITQTVLYFSSNDYDADKASEVPWRHIVQTQASPCPICHILESSSTNFRPY